MRGLGGMPTHGGSRVKPGLFFRGSSLHALTKEDVSYLSQELQIARIIDVRCGWERDKKPDAAVPGADNLHIPFFDKELVGVDYTKSIPGSFPVGNDIVCDPLDFYAAMPNPLTAKMMRKALDAVFECTAVGKTVLVHCSGGKDRAGIMALLVLEVLGASRQDILADYLLTNESRDKNLAPIMERFTRLMGGDPEKGREVTQAHRANAQNLDAFYASVERRYGSVDDFLTQQLGFDQQRREELRAACCEPAA